MAELTIHLGPDPATGRPVVRVELAPDDDFLPGEHEAVHRRAVAALFPGLAEGHVIVERERPAVEPVVG